MANYEKIMRSSQFTFQIGAEKAPLLIHTAVLEKLSAPLHALISNGTMKESKAGVATLNDVDLETFVAFCEFAYTNDYKTPARENITKKAPRPDVTKANRISKRPRRQNRKLENLKRECNTSYPYTELSGEDFDYYHFESLWDSFESRMWSIGSGKSSMPNLMLHAKLYVFSTKIPGGVTA